MKAFEGKMITVEVEDGKEIVRHPAAVGIVAVDAEKRVVLVKQDRPAVGKTLLEIPAGILEPDEEPLAAAQRELREETGLHGGEWKEIGSILTSPGFTDERIHLFIARRLEEGDDDQDEGEGIELERVPRQRVAALLGELEDAKTLAALQVWMRDIPPPAPGEDPGRFASTLSAVFLSAIVLVGILVMLVFVLVVLTPIAIVRALFGRQSWATIRRTPGFFAAALFGGVGGTFTAARRNVRD